MNNDCSNYLELFLVDSSFIDEAANDTLVICHLKQQSAQVLCSKEQESFNDRTMRQR